MTFSEAFKVRIYSILNEKEWSVNHLARKAGLAHTTLHTMINDKYANPTISTLTSLAYALNMTLNEFLDFPEIKNVSPEELEEIKNSKKDKNNQASKDNI